MFDQIPDMAAKRAALTPDAPAFIEHETGRRWTFAQINAAADGVAAGLTSMGIGRGKRLPVLTLNRVEFFVTLFACQKTGIVMAPLNWRQPLAELKEVVESVGASALLFDEDNSQTGRGLAKALGLPAITTGTAQAGETSFADLASTQTAPFTGAISATDPWYLLFTSGTTGTPKAVIQTARMCWANAINIGQAIDLTSQDTSVNFLPMFHTGGINLYTLPVFLFGGVSTVMPRFEAGDILALLCEGKVSQFFGVPAIYQAFSLNDGVDGVDWTAIRCACGGAPLPEPLIHFFAERGCDICNGFGMTETGPTAFLMDRAHAKEKIGSVGKAQLLTEVKLDGVEDGETGEGEVLFRGPGITPGYFGNEDATRKTFTDDGWLKSGDVARRDADGYYFVVDRIKDMYISGGENVYPAEVERVLNAHEAILEAAVIGVADEKWGETGAAFLLARPGADLDTSTLNAWCRERLAAYKVPKSFTVLDDFPRTAAGKVRKPDLRNMRP